MTVCFGVDPDNALYCDSNTGPLRMGMASNLLKIQRLTGWSDTALTRKWHVFSRLPVVHLLAIDHASMMFLAIVALRITRILGEMAWEQVK